MDIRRALKRNIITLKIPFIGGIMVVGPRTEPLLERSVFLFRGNRAIARLRDLYGFSKWVWTDPKEKYVFFPPGLHV